MKQGFDNEAYIKRQSEQIKKRIGEFGGKLYLEFGGKLFDDYHASRVLPGFAPDAKIQMLGSMRDQAEIVIAINASDIAKNKIRGDLGIPYDVDVLRLIDAFREFGLYVGSVVMTRFDGQPAAVAFQQKLNKLGLPVFLHYTIEGYPYDVRRIVSEEGYGKNQYIETTRPLVVVTAPGPGSGKMATCLSQLYHEHLRGVTAGYAKFETFPIWNLPLKHPVNLAYEAATADLSDVNMIDPYHLEAYGKTTVNYNRDIEIFPVLSAMFKRISGSCPYQSPTDMGVNMAGACISDDEACREASKAEIVRRYFTAMTDCQKGRGEEDAVQKIESIMNQMGLSADDRAVFAAARERSAETDDQPAAAIELPDGRIVTGKTSDLLGASSAALLNAVKALAGMEKSVHLIPTPVIEPIQKLKTGLLGGHNPRLHSDEMLVALAVSAASNPQAAEAMAQLPRLRGCEAHVSVILSQVDEEVYRRLGLNLTCTPHYQTSKLYHK